MTRQTLLGPGPLRVTKLDEAGQPAGDPVVVWCQSVTMTTTSQTSPLDDMLERYRLTLDLAAALQRDLCAEARGLGGDPAAEAMHAVGELSGIARLTAAILGDGAHTLASRRGEDADRAVGRLANMAEDFDIDRRNEHEQAVLWRDFALFAVAQLEVETTDVFAVFDGPPSEPGRFVEVETRDGRSCSIEGANWSLVGDDRQPDDGRQFWELGPLRVVGHVRVAWDCTGPAGVPHETQVVTAGQDCGICHRDQDGRLTPATDPAHGLADPIVAPRTVTDRPQA